VIEIFIRGERERERRGAQTWHLKLMMTENK